MKKINRSDILVIGGGVVGTSIARSLGMRYPTKSIRLIEKDKELGQHNSTLNSGVIHSGLYYSSGSNRANYCVKGNKLLTDYHKLKNIPMRDLGKLIIARNFEQSERLIAIYNQGLKNGVDVKLTI